MKKIIQNSIYKNVYNHFDSYVRVKGFKQGKNKTMYQSVVLEFLVWLEESGIVSIEKVTGKEMITYYEYLITRPKQRGEGTLADKTIKFHLFVLGVFMLNLLESQTIKRSFYIPSHSGSVQTPRNILSIDEVKMLYDYCESLQEKALLSIAYGCGLRRSEIEMLDTKDIQLTSGMLIVRKGKNAKRREVPMSDSVLKHIKNYIIEERYQKLQGKNQLEESLFVNTRGKRMSGESLNDLLKKIIEQSNNYELIKRDITLHCLRHSIANHLAENNAGFEFIKRFLGHAELNTTYIYAIKNKKRKSILNFKTTV